MGAWDRTSYQGHAVDRLSLQILTVANKLLRLRKFGAEREDATMMQGSWNKGGVSQSASTHDGGAVFDLTPFNWQNRVKVFRLLGMAYFDRPELWRNGKRYWGHHGHGVVCNMGDASQAAQDQVTEWRAGGDGLAGNAPDKDWRPAVFPLAVFGGNVGLKAAKAKCQAFDQPTTASKVQRELGAGETVSVLMEVNVAGKRWSVTSQGDFVASSKLGAATKNVVPGDVLDLSGWKLTTDEGEPGHPDEVLFPRLDSYESAGHFYADALTSGVVMRAYCGGVTTSGTKYARQEFREMDGADRAEWDTRIRHRLRARLAITHTPKNKPHVVALQIHDGSDDVIQVRLEGKRLYVEADGEDVGLLDANYVLGTPFDIEILTDRVGVGVTYDDRRFVQHKGSWRDCYWKAGCYVQSNTKNKAPFKPDAATDFGEVVIYALEREAA